MKHKRYVRIDLNVDPDTDNDYRQIILSQGENASSDYRRYQREVIDSYQRSSDSVILNPKVHISPREINETLDKWLIDARLRSQDGTIEELKGLSKKIQHYTNIINTYMYTQQQKTEQEKKKKALLESTTSEKRIKELEEQVRWYKEKDREEHAEEFESQAQETTTN